MSTEEMVDREKFVPGHFECPKCKFYLIAKIISTSTGNIGMNTEARQCENGCGPMWLVTWKERCKDLGDSQEHLVNRLIKLQDRITELETQLAEAKNELQGNDRPRSPVAPTLATVSEIFPRREQAPPRGQEVEEPLPPRDWPPLS